MNADRIKEIFEKKLNEKTQNQKVVFTKNENERPHNGSSKEIASFLSSLSDNNIMQREVEEASNRVISLVKDYKNV
ncbi:hypothetical protein [Campylobacter subantarcticus]|uniref:Uncharacterized protein n=1 Tax=Campylobacter subantarcticus LMG 24374 TaxID=1388751 RepID=A0A0A8HAX1_9BACT|nr:hypothetical protein [Campylobacter subantarcticus]AJC90815.1 hypothetical protein CSUB8521_0978 [Campylobacter subantarcticus LMG 24374]EAJ1261729.1 hypothetical protein [Campylobacter lari]